MEVRLVSLFHVFRFFNVVESAMNVAYFVIFNFFFRFFNMVESARNGAYFVIFFSIF